MLTRLKLLLARIVAFFKREELDRDLNEELEAHLGMLTDEFIERGMSRVEARRAAHLELGSLANLREAHRETRGLPVIETLLQDLRYTFRILRRDYGFAIFAVLIVGLGIGASVIIFSVVNALLLRPLPFKDSQNLVWIANGDSIPEQTTQVANLLDARERNKSFEDIGGYFGYYGVGDSKLTGDGEPERLTNVPVSENFFPILGVQPQVGRSFNAEECKINGPRVVILTNSLWKRRFDSNPEIVGKTITLNEKPRTVIGVLPASFDFAAVFAPGSHVDLFSPFPLTPETDRMGNTTAVVGRLKPGATVENAQAEFNILGQQISAEHTDRNVYVPQLSGLKEHVTGRLRPALIVLACAVGVVMLIVCANLSNLLLARNASRQKEMAIRVALGAGRRRLVRQMLTESIVLSGAGAVVGVVLAVAGTRVLSSLNGLSIPLLAHVQIDPLALGFSLLIAVVTGLTFGLVPALQVPSIGVGETLKEGNRGSTGGRRHAWIRGALVVTELAFACVLLVGAGLLIRSFLRVLDVDLGFRPEMAAVMRIDPSSAYNTDEKVNAYYDEALKAVEATPGVTAAGLTDVLPLEGDRSWGVAAVGQVYAKGTHPEAFVRIVSNGYFKAMGIPLISGRDFTSHDTKSSELVIIVNETLAQRLWPGQDPIGQKVTQDKGRRVVGVVGNVRHVSVEQESGSEMYLPMRQTNDYSLVDLVVRTSLPPAGLAPSIRSALKSLDPNMPSNEFRTVQQLVDKATSPRRFVVMMLTGFSVFALILASLGIYAVISYSVSQRTQEIGIRMALGASARELQARIMIQTLRLAVVGLVIGVVASWLLTRTLSGLLFGVTSTDPVTFVGTVVILAVVAAMAGYFPARRASRIDPMEALRG